jgi:hypothetical protein
MKLQAQENARPVATHNVASLTSPVLPFPVVSQSKPQFKEKDMCDLIATGFEFEPQADGNVRIEFCDDHGNPLSTQVMTRGCLLRIMLGAFVTTTVMDIGPEVARKLMRVMDVVDDIEDGLQ